jgi:outer membrane receptor protein involved in Fe transport
MDEVQLVDNISWTHGRHDLKAGAQISRGRSHGDFRWVRDGVYSFERDLPFDLSNPTTYPFSFTVFDGRTAWDYPRWSWGFFIQDGWRLTSDFTLNAGVRYDVDGSYTALNSMIRTDKGLTTVRKDLDNIAPRVGFAWTPFDNGKKTLVRGGAGVYYDENHSNLASLLLSLSILANRSIAVNAFSPGLNPFTPDSARARRFLAEALARNTTPDIVALPAVAGITPDLENDLQVPAGIQTSAAFRMILAAG